jgi:hypothetical protein
VTEFTNKKKTTLEEQTIFRYCCGKEFELEPHFAQEHIKRFPRHNAYRQEAKKIIEERIN